MRLLRLAWLCRSEPSIEKCSSLISPASKAIITIRSLNFLVMSRASSRSRKLVKSLWSKHASSGVMSRNQRKSMSKVIRSHRARSERTVYRLISTSALSSRSGGMLGRPPFSAGAYAAVNVRLIAASASSAIRLMARSG